MQSADIRQKFFSFFEKNGHKRVPSSSLIPDDLSVLLTTAGMQQFKKYYTEPAMADRDFGSRNTVSIQKSFRTSDIDEVGDERHLTFFEMMGNFSFGGYFKTDAIRYAYDFITKEMVLPISYVTIFKGSEIVPKDEESATIWRELGVTDVREEGMEDVFWGPTGAYGPCGPTTEIYCKNAAGQDIEIWNIVFNEFLSSGSREELLAGHAKLEPLAVKGIDTGMGLERLAMCVQGKKNIFETDLYTPLMRHIPADFTDVQKRVIADHGRASAFLLADGVRPSNKDRGYILRRLLRRAVVLQDVAPIITETIDRYGSVYPELVRERQNIISAYAEEKEKFARTLRQGLKELERMEQVMASSAFRLYESYGLPYEVIKDYKNGALARHLTREAFDEEFKKHQEISRAGAQAKFGGHGLYMKTGEVTIRDESEVEMVTRLHTATHLLHAGLRAVLGPEVRQDGSDITVERTRFDFRFPRKVMPEELQKVEQWVNDAVRRDLVVAWEEMAYEEGIKKGALGFFREKYPPRVKIYTMTD
ncbi:MAG: alanine--tRNA ligase-related protein, partial [Patescibacteria group bacterium]